MKTSIQAVTAVAQVPGGAEHPANGREPVLNAPLVVPAMAAEEVL